MIVEHLPVAEIRDTALESFMWTDEMTETLNEFNTENVTFRTPEGDLIGIFGVTRQWVGVGTAWALVNPVAQRYTFRMTRGISPWLDKAVERMRLWRVHATVAESHYNADRWIQMLGFKCEAHLKYYLPTGEHAWMFSKTYINSSRPGQIGGLH